MSLTLALAIACAVLALSTLVLLGRATHWRKQADKWKGVAHRVAPVPTPRRRGGRGGDAL